MAKKKAATKAAKRPITMDVAREVTPIQEPAYIATDSGTVTVYGHEFVSKKDLVILGYCLNMPEFKKDMGTGYSAHNVKSVVFRSDNRPKNSEGKPILAN
jgi:hypothetical protein